MPEYQEYTLQWQALLADLGLLPPGWMDESLEQQDHAITQASLRLLALQAELQGEDNIKGIHYLQDIWKSGMQRQFIEQMTPQFSAFERLRAALHHQQAIAALPRPDLTELAELGLGQAHPDLASLRQLIALRLQQILPSALEHRTVWDPPFELLLKEYQRRHGLAPSGRLDPATQKSLTLDPALRLQQIRFSLLQWFQLPSQLEGYSILVNIPHFQLVVLNGERVELVLPVVVGKPQTPTPRMNSRFRSVTLNPTWTPPSSIVRNELLPAYRNNPSSLASQGFYLSSASQEVLPWEQVELDGLEQQLGRYRLVQAPGRANPLGKMRLNLTASDAIYLHDSNNKALFGHRQRAYSHGCVRVGEAEQVLQYLASQETKDTARRLELALGSRKTVTQRLQSSIGVYLVYMPAWASEGNGLVLKPDIYHLASQG
ncbi:L,D-transpeptidase family protein [Ferrimonas pelagia]|uniref:L,D-transpeptidase family protein n=1 Tax=Ferrimonas pelagia TaxID=1177826 RepID=UPI0031F01710